MSKKRNENSFWNNGPDSELIARFTGSLKQVLLNERSTYLKNPKKKELMEFSFEELEEKGQFQNQFAVDEIENILMWEAIRNHISLGACETEYGDSLSCDYPSRFEIRCEN